MTISKLIATKVIGWLKGKHPDLLRDAVIPSGSHVHKNPPKGERKKKGR